MDACMDRCKNYGVWDCGLLMLVIGRRRDKAVKVWWCVLTKEMMMGRKSIVGVCSQKRHLWQKARKRMAVSGLWHFSRHRAYSYKLATRVVLANLPGWCWAEIQQFALIGSSSSLHSEACNALGASDGVIHSSISHEAACL